MEKGRREISRGKQYQESHKCRMQVRETVKEAAVLRFRIILEYEGRQLD